MAKKKYSIHVCQTIDDYYDIEAETEQEALDLAEEGYENGDYNPSETQGELGHYCEIEDQRQKNKYLFQDVIDHMLYTIEGFEDQDFTYERLADELVCDIDDGTLFCDISKNEQYVKDHFDDFGEVIDKMKETYGHFDGNPFKDSGQFIIDSYHFIANEVMYDIFQDGSKEVHLDQKTIKDIQTKLENHSKQMVRLKENYQINDKEVKEAGKDIFNKGGEGR